MTTPETRVLPRRLPAHTLMTTCSSIAATRDPHPVILTTLSLGFDFRNTRASDDALPGAIQGNRPRLFRLAIYSADFTRERASVQGRLASRGHVAVGSRRIVYPEVITCFRESNIERQLGTWFPKDYRIGIGPPIKAPPEI